LTVTIAGERIAEGGTGLRRAKVRSGYLCKDFQQISVRFPSNGTVSSKTVIRNEEQSGGDRDAPFIIVFPTRMD
jgi:hypothetical protein